MPSRVVIPAPPGSSARHWFQTGILEWYAHNRRDLPWRHTMDPYAIWVSEIMLQQTQVERVREYYRRFLERFPHVDVLAEAPWEDVLEYWRGLGYYRRGRMMLETARAIADRHRGTFPDNLADLLALPGVGVYTAGAIQSFARNLPVPALDTNGVRILRRVFSEVPLEEAPSAAAAWNALDLSLIPDGRSRDFHSALMDLGSLICLGRQPRCGECPLRERCQARLRADPGLTVRASSRKAEVAANPGGLPVVEAAIAIIRDERQRILISRRPRGVHLGGLWEFPGGKREGRESWRSCLKREILEELGIEISVRPVWRVVRHTYPERIVELHVHRCWLLLGTPAGLEGQEVRWVEAGELGDYEFPAANASLVRDLIPGRR